MSDSQRYGSVTGPRRNMPDRRRRELWQEWVSDKVVRGTALVLGVCALLVVLGPCTLTHKFGPYYGKTVDASTGKPIVGAVVLVSFYTDLYSFGESKSRFVDALEVMTDTNGEFRIPAHRAWAFRAPHGWSSEGRVLIFKQGYGSFPWHKDVTPKFSPAYAAPPNEYLVIKLPKLGTPEETAENLSHLPIADIPTDKMKKLLERIEPKRIVPYTEAVCVGISSDEPPLPLGDP